MIGSALSLAFCSKGDGGAAKCRVHRWAVEAVTEDVVDSFDAGHDEDVSSVTVFVMDCARLWSAAAGGPLPNV